MKAFKFLLLALLFSQSVLSKEDEDANDLHFPGDEPEHKVVYQFNKADLDYQRAIFFSITAMLKKYGDNIKIVVSAFGPGIHILAKKPGRIIDEITPMRIKSLSQYGVEFHACNNTLTSLHWTKEDIVPHATIVDVGASDIMELQENGYKYISW